MNTVHVAALAALFCSLPSLASAQMRLEQTSEGARLVNATGAPVHETTAQIEGLRLIPIANSRVRVAIWNEVEGGSSTPYYAISLDGQHIDAVKATSYELLFRRAQFDPLRGAPTFEGSPFTASGEVFIVQYVTQPLLEYSDAITALGGRVYDFVESHAHLVRMSAATRDAVAKLPFVRWIGAYHPEFRVEPEILAELQAGTLATMRVNVMCFERGAAQQELVAARVTALGGSVQLITPQGFRMEATLTPEQLVAIASLDEVKVIDRWGPPSDDMDIARQFSGANYVQATPGNYQGQGVNAEVLDGGCDLSHPDFTGETAHGSVPVGVHGTCTSGIVFGTGAGNAQARGAMPLGHLVSGYYLGYVGGNRYTHTAELVNPSLSYQCVLQSNSWGGNLTTSYNSISAELDDIVVINDLLICQSQSNTGSQQSRPEAWGKNVLSVGGIYHQNTLTPSDDTWNFSGSIGPASDGRLKPDLAHFYDWVFTLDQVGGGGYTSSNYYDNFGGTSAATPITAGMSGLFFQMWHDGIFGNTPVGATVFAGRPHFALAKAAMINTASQWTFSGTGSDLTRTHQGWGAANLQRLYDLRSKTFFVDQTDVINNLGGISYNLAVPAGEPSFKATLVYRDAMGTVSGSQHRKNDLTLKVTAPSGTIYYGNNGLGAGNWSTSGGSPNTKDTVENVFVQNPTAGTWLVEVRGDDINTNPLTNTPASSADFALWVTGVTGATSCQSPAIYCTSKITSGFTSPAIGYTGTPSIAANNLTVTLINALPNKNGLLFYGALQQSVPFKGGTLCAQQPLIRSPVITTTGSSTASMPIALNALMVGTTRNYQWWFRDPQDAFTTGLSNALQVTFCN